MAGGQSRGGGRVGGGGEGRRQIRGGGGGECVRRTHRVEENAVPLLDSDLDRIRPIDLRRQRLAQPSPRAVRHRQYLRLLGLRHRLGQGPGLLEGARRCEEGAAAASERREGEDPARP